jgi:HSP20 family protein
MSIMKKNENFMFPALFNDFFGRDWLDFNARTFSSTNTTIPSVNILESEDNFELEVAAPGFEKKDFKIELNNNVLTISSDKQEETEHTEGKQFTRKEYSYLSFCRSFTIPESANKEKIEANYEQGILKVIIPKREESKPKPLREIKIK